MSNNWEETGTRALCLRFNFPLRKKVSRGKTSLKDLISNNLDEEVEIFLEDTMHYYKLK